MKKKIRLEAWSSKFVDGPVMFYREGVLPADPESYSRLSDYDIEKEIEVEDRPIQITKSELLRALHDAHKGAHPEVIFRDVSSLESQ